MIIDNHGDGGFVVIIDAQNISNKNKYGDTIMVETDQGIYECNCQDKEDCGEIKVTQGH